MIPLSVPSFDCALTTGEQNAIAGRNPLSAGLVRAKTLQERRPPDGVRGSPSGDRRVDQMTADRGQMSEARSSDIWRLTLTSEI
jgi:hypothetical protein